MYSPAPLTPSNYWIRRPNSGSAPISEAKPLRDDPRHLRPELTRESALEVFAYLMQLGTIELRDP